MQLLCTATGDPGFMVLLSVPPASPPRDPVAVHGLGGAGFQFGGRLSVSPAFDMFSFVGHFVPLGVAAWRRLGASKKKKNTQSKVKGILGINHETSDVQVDDEVHQVQEKT